jgi:hypothetical protein
MLPIISLSKAGRRIGGTFGFACVLACNEWNRKYDIRAKTFFFVYSTDHGFDSYPHLY